MNTDSEHPTRGTQQTQGTLALTPALSPEEREIDATLSLRRGREDGERFRLPQRTHRENLRSLLRAGMEGPDKPTISFELGSSDQECDFLIMFCSIVASAKWRKRNFRKYFRR